MRLNQREVFTNGLRSRIRYTRRNRGISLGLLADRAKIPKAALEHFMRGHINEVRMNPGFYNRLLKVGRNDVSFWDPLARRLIIALRDFDTIH